MAIVLIVIGLAGMFAATWLGGADVFPGWMVPRGGMMPMISGSGMMHQNRMREMMHEMMSGRLPPGVKPETLPNPDSSGAKLLVRYCAQCHNLPGPAMHTAGEWPAVETRMVSRMERMSRMRGMMDGMMGRGMMDVQAPTVEEENDLLTYLQRNSLRPARGEALGPPDTPGLSLFRQTCSRCHDLPDPRLHTGDEWSPVVERMRKNMEIMGKPMITDKERDDIVTFLRRETR